MITVVSSDSKISVRQAADMLNVSISHVVKLLENGEIPYEKAGAHRRLLLRDVISYEARVQTNRDRELRFLTKQAQDLNLGYE